MADKDASVPYVCPSCLGSLQMASQGLSCEAEGLVYPICDGIPVLLVDQAQPLST